MHFFLGRVCFKRAEAILLIVLDFDEDEIAECPKGKGKHLFEVRRVSKLANHLLDFHFHKSFFLYLCYNTMHAL